MPQLLIYRSYLAKFVNSRYSPVNAATNFVQPPVKLAFTYTCVCTYLIGNFAFQSLHIFGQYHKKIWSKSFQILVYLFKNKSQIKKVLKIKTLTLDSTRTRTQALRVRNHDALQSANLEFCWLMANLDVIMLCVSVCHILMRRLTNAQFYEQKAFYAYAHTEHIMHINKTLLYLNYSLHRFWAKS